MSCTTAASTLPSFISCCIFSVYTGNVRKCTYKGMPSSILCPGATHAWLGTRGSRSCDKGADGPSPCWCMRGALPGLLAVEAPRFDLLLTALPVWVCLRGCLRLPISAGCAIRFLLCVDSAPCLSRSTIWPLLNFQHSA